MNVRACVRPLQSLRKKRGKYQAHRPRRATWEQARRCWLRVSRERPPEPCPDHRMTSWRTLAGMPPLECWNVCLVCHPSMVSGSHTGVAGGSEHHRGAIRCCHPDVTTRRWLATYSGKHMVRPASRTEANSQLCLMRTRSRAWKEVVAARALLEVDSDVSSDHDPP